MWTARTSALLLDGFLFFVVSVQKASGFVAIPPKPLRGARRGKACIATFLSEHSVTTDAVDSQGASGKCWESEAIRWIDDVLDQKSKQSPFAIEEPGDDNTPIVPFEWVVGGPDDRGDSPGSSPIRNKKVALRTIGATPLLDAESIASIRNAAENLWDGRGSSGPTSRFTLQFENTNSECHLDELVESNAALKEVVDNLLTTKVYPLARSAFGDSGGGGQRLTDGRLCVYDSLVVRYDGNKATDRFEASQPLHRDGGVVSVNIALNSHDVAKETRRADRFTGGGTFFEDLMGREPNEHQSENENEASGGDASPVLRPLAAGHALAHWSTKRHAGAPTTSGTRDILVFFLTQRKATETAAAGAVPKSAFSGIERSFHLKLKAQEIPGGLALRCLDLAMEETPFDGQAHFLKGFHLMRGGTTPKDGRGNTTEDEEQRWRELQQSVFHLVRAAEYAPFDARIQCHLGMAYRQRWMFAKRTNRTRDITGSDSSENGEQRELCKATESLRRALFLHDRYQRHGIASDFDDNVLVARLTLGEVLAQLERYSDAIQCLSKIESHSLDADKPKDKAMAQHIAAVVAHCIEQE
ncbi:unnamed protein product [Pseudo-nitzschia multistriata]|uniref:Fe2OG dioxygenase domain-containing protein n=1 Tax=Pseudo-nitzschia multistriata TaxID=183589 RepID=A0A448ZSX0_9STRA|nr:unnamed protein product [Pseudo-nitzschia multistriata]